MEAIELVQHAHIEWRARRTFFLVAAHVEVRVASTPVGKTVNEPRIAVEGENDWLVRSEQRVEIVIRKAMRMLALRLQFHEIHDVDNTHLQVGRVSAKEVDSCQSLQCWDIAAASHHDIGLLATIIAGPFPDPKPGSAVLDRLV